MMRVNRVNALLLILSLISSHSHLRVRLSHNRARNQHFCYGGLGEWSRRAFSE